MTTQKTDQLLNETLALLQTAMQLSLLSGNQELQHKTLNAISATQQAQAHQNQS